MQETKRTPFYKYIASQLARAEHFVDRDVPRWDDIRSALCDYVRKHGPSGGGFDMGTELDLDRSTKDRLVFTTEFHHMNEGGYYDGWTQHTVTVRPDFLFEIDIRVSGRDRNGIKDYITDTFRSWLNTHHVHPALVENEA